MPTAADMAQLGFEIVAGHQSRRPQIAGIIAAAQDHAVQTGRFVERLHQGTRARKQENRRLMRELRTEDKARHMAAQEHAAQTTRACKRENARFMRALRMEDKARHVAAQEHAAQTGAFVGHLHRGTRARKQEVRAQLAGYAAEMKGARRTWREHQREVSAQIRAYAAEMKGARKAWREQRAPNAKTKEPIRGFAK
jgi:hypothetical protein